MKSKKVFVWQDKKTKSIFINPTEPKGNKFITKTPTKDFGSANSNKISDEELGRKVREALENAD